MIDWEVSYSANTPHGRYLIWQPDQIPRWRIEHSHEAWRTRVGEWYATADEAKAAAVEHLRGLSAES